MRQARNASNPAFLNEILYAKAPGPPRPLSYALNIIKDFFQITLLPSRDNHRSELPAACNTYALAFRCAFDNLGQLLLGFE
jgi:hypothetical protein